MEGRYDPRNQLNDLTGKEWLKLTKSFWISETCADDKAAFGHPAPFMIKDIETLGYRLMVCVKIGVFIRQKLNIQSFLI